jgi:hypothetical protein
LSLSYATLQEKLAPLAVVMAVEFDVDTVCGELPDTLTFTGP